MITALVAILCLSLLSSRQNYLHSAEVNTRNMSRLLEEQTIHTLHGIESTLSVFTTIWGQIPHQRRPHAVDLHNLLKERAGTNETLRSLYILDTHGTMVLDSQSFPSPALDMSDRDYFRVHTQSESGLFISSMMVGRITGRWGMVLSRRLQDPDGNFAGVIVAAVEPTKLGQAYTGIDLGEFGSMNLRHVDGSLIVRAPVVEGAVGRILPTTKGYLAEIDRSGISVGETTSSIDGRLRIRTARRVPHTPLLVSVALSKEEVLEPWYQSALSYVGAAMALIVLIVVMTRQLMRDQKSQTTLMEKVERSESLLRQHRDQLQEMVELRTHDLVTARDAAEQANRAKTVFLSNMSHELRTPMHAILSFAQLGTARSQNLQRETIERYFGNVLRAAQRLMRLLDDLLDLSKLEAGKMEMHFAASDVLALLRESVEESSALAHEKNIRCSIEHTLQPLSVWCDHARILQVLRNLLSNAIKFSPEAATVRLRAYADTLDAVRAVSIEVADFGIGIPESELESIFDKFVQSSKTKSAAGGTGLGLSICREITQAHGGRLTAHSSPDAGTRFVLTLPAWDGGQRQSSPGLVATDVL